MDLTNASAIGARGFGDAVRAYVIAHAPNDPANLADEQGHACAAYRDDIRGGMGLD